MKYYPAISGNQHGIDLGYVLVHSIEPLFIDNVVGIMELSDRWAFSELSINHVNLKETFFGKELENLAHGSDDEIISISKEFGVLCSPYGSRLHDFVTRETLDSFRLPKEEYRESIIAAFDALSISMLNELYLSGVHQTDIDAIEESLKLTRALIQAEKELRGKVVSISEIRATAKHFIATRETIRAMAEKLSTVEIEKLSLERGGFPLGSFDFFDLCLSEIPRKFGRLLENEFGEKVTKIDLILAHGTDVIIKGDEQSIDFRLAPLSYENGEQPYTLAQGITALLYEVARAKRTWEKCDHCETLFPLKPGQMRDIKHLPDKSAPGRYCSQECQQKAKYKRQNDRR